MRGTYAFTEGWLSSFRAHVGGYSSHEPHAFYWLTPSEYADAPCPNRRVAEAFGSIDSPDNIETASIQMYADEEIVLGYGYETSGRLTRLIIDRFELDQYFALYIALDDKDGLAAISAAMDDVPGVPFAELDAEFSSRSCAIDRWRFYDYECGALPVTAWENLTHWSTDVGLSCANEDVIGPRRGIESKKDVEFIWTLRAGPHAARCTATIAKPTQR